VNASFGYDGVGRRRAKTVGGTTTEFLYDSLNPVQELASGVPAANILTGLAIDEYFQRTDPSSTRHYLTDALGSVIALTDAAGAVQTSYTYEPFGTSTTAGASTTNPMGFTSREADGTGVYFYRARYYDPRLQRFSAEDPEGVVDGFNMHRYANDDPVNRVDPLGLSSVIFGRLPPIRFPPPRNLPPNGRYNPAARVPKETPPQYPRHVPGWPLHIEPINIPPWLQALLDALELLGGGRHGGSGYGGSGARGVATPVAPGPTSGRKPDCWVEIIGIGTGTEILVCAA
jgi:RHS repeat-associated protein